MERSTFGSVVEWIAERYLFIFVEQWIAERCYIRFCSTMDNREISYQVLQYKLIVERSPIRFYITIDSKDLSYEVLLYSGQYIDLPLVLQYNGKQRDLLLGYVLQWIVERSPIWFCITMDRREISHYVLQFSGLQKDLPLVMWQNGQQRDISSDLQKNGQQRDVPLGSVVQWIIDRPPIRLCTTMDSKDLSNKILQYNRKQRDLRIVESREISHQVLQYSEQQRDLLSVLWYN